MLGTAQAFGGVARPPKNAQGVVNGDLKLTEETHAYVGGQGLGKGGECVNKAWVRQRQEGQCVWGGSWSYQQKGGAHGFGGVGARSTARAGNILGEVVNAEEGFGRGTGGKVEKGKGRRQVHRLEGGGCTQQAVG